LPSRENSRGRACQGVQMISRSIRISTSFLSLPLLLCHSHQGKQAICQGIHSSSISSTARGALGDRATRTAPVLWRGAISTGTRMPALSGGTGDDLFGVHHEVQMEGGEEEEGRQSRKSVSSSIRHPHQQQRHLAQGFSQRSAQCDKTACPEKG
jgi:hypothetical protein